MFVNSYCGEDGKIKKVESECGFFVRTARRVGAGGHLLVADVTINEIGYSFGYSKNAGFSFLSTKLPEIVWLGSSSRDTRAYFEQDGMLFYMDNLGGMVVIPAK